MAIGWGRILALLSQVALGILLPVETFAVFAVVLLLASLLSGFQDAGLAKVLVAAQRRFDQLVESTTGRAFTFAVIGASLMIVFGVGLEMTTHREYDMLSFAAILTALSMPLTAYALIQTSSLSVEHRFKEIAAVDVARNSLYYVLLILLAWLGLGGMTMAAATLGGAVLNVLILQRLVGARVPRPCMVGPRPMAAMVRENRYVLGASFLSSLATRGDYIVLTFWLTPRELAFYHFGFMLLAQAMAVVTTALSQVLAPVYARMNDDTARVAAAARRGCVAALTMAGVISLGVVLFGPPLMSWVWDGKWDEAALVVSTIALSLPVRVCGVISVSVMEAMGWWRARFMLLMADSVLLVTFAFAGVWLGGFEGAAYMVAAQRFVSGVTFFLYTQVKLDAPAWKSIRVFVVAALPFAAAASSVLLSLPGTDPLLEDGSLLTASAVAASVFLVLTTMCNAPAVRQLGGRLCNRNTL